MQQWHFVALRVDVLVTQSERESWGKSTRASGRHVVDASEEPQGFRCKPFGSGNRVVLAQTFKHEEAGRQFNYSNEKAPLEGQLCAQGCSSRDHHIQNQKEIQAKQKDETNPSGTEASAIELRAHLEGVLGPSPMQPSQAVHCKRVQLSVLQGSSVTPRPTQRHTPCALRADADVTGHRRTACAERLAGVIVAHVVILVARVV